MLTTVEGVYQSGKIELKELPHNVHEGTPVIVTFFPEYPIDLQAHGIDTIQAKELRARLGTFAEDWESSEMDVYNNYDANKTNL